MTGGSEFDGLELITTAVLMLDRQRKIVYANPAAEHLLALSRRQLVGLQLAQVFRDSEQLAPAIELAAQHGASYTEHEIELHLSGKVNGASRLVINCTASWLDAARQPNAPQLLLELRHIDQELKLAREARVAEQNHANRELVRNLAHEIKNPLGGVRGAAQLLQHELSSPQLVEYTQVIIAEADRLQALVNRLLTPHKLPQFVATDIHLVLDRVRQLMQNEFGHTHTIIADYDVSLPEVEIDSEQMTQVLLNIARNACQSSAEADAPEVRLRTRIARQVVLAKRRHRMALEIAIIDNGSGILPEHRDRIFFPLFTTRSAGSGSGLGLSIAQTFVTQHFGSIEVESEPGHTVFRVQLPFAHPTDAAAAGTAI